MDSIGYSVLIRVFEWSGARNPISGGPQSERVLRCDLNSRWTRQLGSSLGTDGDLNACGFEHLVDCNGKLHVHVIGFACWSNSRWGERDRAGSEACPTDRFISEIKIKVFINAEKSDADIAAKCPAAHREGMLGGVEFSGGGIDNPWR